MKTGNWISKGSFPKALFLAWRNFVKVKRLTKSLWHQFYESVWPIWILCIATFALCICARRCTLNLFNGFLLTVWASSLLLLCQIAFTEWRRMTNSNVVSRTFLFISCQSLNGHSVETNKELFSNAQFLRGTKISALFMFCRLFQSC